MNSHIMDLYINNLLFNLRHPLAIKIFSIITLFGESWTILLFILIACTVLFLSNKKLYILGLILSASGSIGLTFFLKNFFNRPRPLNALILETSASFPSGHATIAVSFYGFILYLLIKKKIKQKKYRILASLCGLIFILLIGFSRLYLSVHYLSDVLFGYLVGLLWLIIGTKLNNYSCIKKV